MLLRIICVLLLAMPITGVCFADDDEQSLVRLPGQGELKEDTTQLQGSDRLVPGGGLLLSFDSNTDGLITQEEISVGITAAFKLADSNEDERITPLEQVKWIETLPTRDVSLANPARFDPNLDRSVRMFEFEEIVLALAALYADQATGSVAVSALRSDPSISAEDSNAVAQLSD